MIQSSLAGKTTKHDLTEKLRKSTFRVMIGVFLKRAFDILASGFGLLFISPFFILIAFFIKRDSPGPVFFWCQRMGRNCRPFRMLKFRTMYELPSSYQGPPVTCNGDDRITPFGQWLRDTKINELPQLWNVLIGEMSMVGPRPEDVDIAQDWPEDAKQEILSVRPGITSPASILYRDEEKLLSKENVMGEYINNILPDKMRLDRLYVRHQSFYADLDILFWTMVIFIPRIVRTKIPETLVFAGPFSRLRHRYVNWFIIDLLISLFAVGVVGFLWRLQMPLNWGIDHLTILAIALAFTFSGVNSITGLNRIVWSKATVEDGINLIFINSVVTFSIFVLNTLQSIYGWFHHPALPVIMILIIGLLAQIGFVIARFRLRLLTAIASRWLNWRQYAPTAGERVLIVGSGDGFQTACWLLRQREFRYIFNIAGVVDDNIPNQLGMWVNGCLVLGRTVDIPDLVTKHDIGVIIFTISNISADLKESINNLCQNYNLRIAFINQMIDLLSQQLTQPIDELDHLIWTEDHFIYRSLYDAVTGLPNGFLFKEYLLHSIALSRRYHTRTAVMFIRLKVFSNYREKYGNKVCASILKQLTKRLLKLKRESDTLAYLDKEEFGLILENVPDEKVVHSIAKRIQNSFSEPFMVRGGEVVLHPIISACSNLSDYLQHRGIRVQDVEKLLSQKRAVLVSGEDQDM